MKKNISSLLILSLAFGTSVHGWGGKTNEGETPPITEGVNNPNIHLHGDDERGYFKLSYLYYKPHLENLNFATLVTNGAGLNGTTGSIKTKSPHFEWSSGIRLNLGRYLPKHDNWDVGLGVTYYYSQAKNEVSVPGGAAANTSDYYIPQALPETLGDFSTNASDHWKMNFFVYDLGIAREYFLTPRILAKPYLGVRGITLYQDDNARYGSFFYLAGGTVSPTLVKTKLTSEMETWGIGVRGACDLVFDLPSHFSIFGNLGGSLLYGHYEATQKVQNGRLHPNLAVYEPKVFNHAFELQTGLEGSFGLKWEHWYPKNNNRVTLSAAFEAQRWFNINKWGWVNQSMPVPGENLVQNSIQNNGDLNIVGFTFALQWDF